MKRGRNSTLTGGTGDVNFQTMVMTNLQTAANTPSVIATPLPIPRLPTQDGKSIVMELLRADISVNDLTPTAAQSEVVVAITTNPNPPTGSFRALFADPRTVAIWRADEIFSTAAGFQYIFPIARVDINDGSGHGFLVAVDNLTMVVISTGLAAPVEGLARLYYRFKAVALAEYIGVVQGQQ